MAERRPLVLIDGTPRELPSGDNVPFGDLLSTPQTWTASQAFSAGITGGVSTITLSSNAATIPLDGRCHVLDLESATGTVTLTIAAPSSGEWKSSLLVVIQSSTARAISYSGATRMDAVELPSQNDKVSFWVLTGFDSFVFVTWAGSQP